jgi:molybdate transport system ATP-binding protein
MSLLEFDCRLKYLSGFQVAARFATEARVTALVGPSGAGKTSILSMIAGLRRPTDGSIRLAQRPLFDQARRIHLPPERRRIGYVFQDQLLFPHLSVRANLLYGWRRAPPGPRRIELERVASVLELEGLLERLPHTLSGGERQRAALGRALLSNPELLLLDEPLASIGEELKQRVLAYIEQVLEQWSIPTLYVTHNPDEARRMAQWAVVVERGAVTATGLPGEVLTGRSPTAASDPPNGRSSASGA